MDERRLLWLTVAVESALLVVGGALIALMLL